MNARALGRLTGRGLLIVFLGVSASLGAQEIFIPLQRPQTVSPADVKRYIEACEAAFAKAAASGSASQGARPAIASALRASPPLPSPANASNPYQRAVITRRAAPPFGPVAMPGLDGPGYTIEDWERAYYLWRPEEYSRFIELFGDIHALR